MVLRKLIGKKSLREKLGATTTFQSFDDDSNELGQSGPCQLSPKKLLTLKSRAHTAGEIVASQEGTGRLPSPSCRRQPLLLRAPSSDEMSCSYKSGCENAPDEQSCSGSECSAETSSWCSYGIDDLPEQFHMSSACTVDAPAQFVVPNSTSLDTGDDKTDGGSASNSSLLHFTPLWGDQSDNDENENTHKEILEEVCIQEDSSQSSNKSKKEKQLKSRSRKPKKHHGSRLKRRSDDETTRKTQNCTIDPAASIKKEPDSLKKIDVSCQDQKRTANLSPCPRSPAKILRNFKRTIATTPRANAAQKAVVKDGHLPTPGNTALSPLSNDVTHPMTMNQLPMINLLDSNNPLATPIKYSVDLHRQTPVKQREKYVLGENAGESLPPIEMVGGVAEHKQPRTESRRGSLQHVPRPSATKYPRRLSCPMNNRNDKDENDDAFDRVIGLIDSHAREASPVDSNEVRATRSRKKSTVDDLKRKIQKDRERTEEKRWQCNVESKSSVGSKRLNSPRRTGKGRRLAARRQLEPAPLDLTK